MKDETRAPKKEPKGIEAVMAPWIEDTLPYSQHGYSTTLEGQAYGLLKYRL